MYHAPGRIATDFLSCGLVLRFYRAYALGAVERAMRTLTHSTRNWLNAALAFVYPENCQLCGRARATPEESYVCAGCRDQVRFIERPFCERCGMPAQGAITNVFVCGNCRELNLHFQYARAAVVARDQVLELIHRYKYHRALWFEPLLAEWLVSRAQPVLVEGLWDWLVPIPLHPAKERQREFNQAERLARRLSRATQIPLNLRLLRRVVATRTQTELSRQERLANVHNAFAVPAEAKLDGERIVLVDDVFTTGATSSACAKVLKAAGAGEVCVWTVARGI
jgi:competence protein ComFC